MRSILLSAWLFMVVFSIIQLSIHAQDNSRNAPEFTGIQDWVNSKPLKMSDNKGKVVIVHFWAHGCINCIHNYPHYRNWTKKIGKSSDLVMIGVHTPEFDSEKNLDRIEAQIKKHDLSFPVAVDNNGATWKAWGNHYWPAVYLIDRSGKIRERWEGELGEAGYEKLTKKIDQLLAEK
jgi:peroxiredoxin